jgi:transcriptional regulator with XRE-family HTH domain
MEIGKRIKELRSDKGWNQEEFAEKVYVSRQTVSSWENDKSYPDIKSLLLMSDLFGITLDELVKGDIQVMKNEINSESIRKFRILSNIYGFGFIFAMLIFYPLYHFAGNMGFLIWFLYMIPVACLAIYIEKLKKTNDMVTYKEIVAYTEGKKLDKDTKLQEKAKRPYQQILLAIGAAGLTLAVILIEKLLLG